MIKALRKTGGRTGQFLGNALTWRLPDREYAVVAWGLILGAIWLLVIGSEDGLVISSYLLAVLAAVSAIDARYGIIPDGLVLALAIGGVVQTLLLASPEVLLEHAGEAVLVLAAVSLFCAGYRFMRGQDGLGFGDVKFVTAGVLWLGIEGVPGLILAGVLSALASLAILRTDGHKLSGRQAISFGPHLALALWLIWVAGPRSF
jgi:leader peptidase (prepilin peptidase)/N-methyltransferase